jgi:hypothetical protein
VEIEGESVFRDFISPKSREDSKGTEDIRPMDFPFGMKNYNIRLLLFHSFL